MFVVTPYTFQPLFQRFVTLWIYAQYVAECLTVTLSYLCCGCCEPPQISLSTCSATILDLGDMRNDDQIISPTLNDVSMASGEPIGSQDVVIDIIPPDLLTPEYKTDFQNINEVKNLVTLAHTDNLKDVCMEMSSCSTYCDHLSMENGKLIDIVKT